MHGFPTLLLVSCLLAARVAVADFVDSINALRTRGCENRSATRAALKSSRAFDEIAREWSEGGRLHEAIARTKHRVASSSSVHVEGARDEAAILEMLADNYCSVIGDPAFSDIGLFRRDNHVWIVVGTPFTPPVAPDASAASRRVLELVNQARAKPRKCGRNELPPAPPLELSPLLERAALMHAKDMAAHSRFEHEGSDGSRPAQRATKAGYRWRAVAENIAAGSHEVETVVRGWLESPGHCSNIMSAQYAQMGVAYAVNAQSKDGIYWAQVFGKR